VTARAASRASLASVALALIAGCAVGPNFRTPVPPIPASLAPPASEGAAAASAAPVPDRWWDGFGDAQLSRLIAEAAAANLDVRDATIRVTEARAQARIADADQWPSIGGGASYQRQRLSERTAEGRLLTGLPGLPNPADQYQLGFDASWEVDLFGRVRREVEAAGADTQAAVEARHDALVTLEGDVARDYIEARSLQAQLSVTEANLATQREVLQVTSDRERSGLGVGLDTANAAAQVAATEGQIPTLRAQLSARINALSFLLAREPRAVAAELAAAQAVPAGPATPAVGLPADLVRRRPDIRAAEARLHAATARQGVAVADLFPKLTLAASFGVQSQHPGDLTSWASRFLQAGPSLEIPIFEGGRRVATMDLRRAETQETATAYARTVLAAFHDVDDALTAYGEELRRHAALGEAVAQSRDALQLARLRYADGVTDFLSVLDAERNLQANEGALAVSTGQVSTDEVALYKALGGGWDLPELATAGSAADRQARR